VESASLYDLLMGDEAREIARRFMQTYVDGDVEALLGCLTTDWVIHDVDGSASSQSDMGEITAFTPTVFLR
jgi:ketosteroid isomerase-like protein